MGREKEKKKKHADTNMADQVKYLKGSSALPRKRCWDDGGCGIIEEMKNSENPILLLQLISLNGQWNEMFLLGMKKKHFQEEMEHSYEAL